MKFAHKIVAASALILLLSLTLLSVNQYISMENKIEGIIENSVSEILQGISTSVESEMKGKISLAQYTTSLVERNFSLQQARGVIDQSVLNDNFILIGFGHESSGDYVASDPDWNPGSSWDPRKRPWYVDAKTAGKAIVTAPYADAVSKEILVSIGTPVQQHGTFSGAIFFDVSLSGLAKMINKVNLLDAGYAFMVTQKGTVISHPEARFNGQPMSQFLTGVAIKSGIQTAHIKNEKTLISFRKVEGLDWYVGVALHHDKAFEATNSLRTEAIVYSLLFLAIGVSVLLFLIKLLMRPLEQINIAMEKVASGHADLTVRLDTHSDVEFAQLAENFNRFTGMLQVLVKDIQDKGHELLSEINNTAMSASHTKEAVHKQMAELSALAICTNQLEATANEVSETAKRASSAVERADSAAVNGGDVIENTASSVTRLAQQIDSTVNVITELEQASTGIEKILSVINGIAEQTNLLALNAAIEAARAGESGRGFAVVADEVRTLAQRTQEATTEIRGMIEQLQSGTTSAVEEMKQSKNIADNTVSEANKTHEALEQIRAAIKTLLELNIGIAQSSQEQVIVVEEVNRNTVNLKDISQQISEQTEVVNDTIKKQQESVLEQESRLNQFSV